ncbi:hypothetical protein [Actinomadura roseirufa]|uniref:hypothetical protein n=1 Tax=Actinomadura roseirufa TaxID=2094049 RepID=UPI001040E457|nr:hypothetical protein [Actinomadura roseirufa]
MSAERLDELALLLRHRVPGLTPMLPRGTEILHLIRSGAGPHYVVWRRSAAAYFWYSGPDHGAQIGTTAEQAAEEIRRMLSPPAP